MIDLGCDQDAVRLVDSHPDAPAAKALNRAREVFNGQREREHAFSPVA
jgi:hypothetical protein